MILFSEVSKSFRVAGEPRVILNRASFAIAPGEPLGILAPNGTGKTTVINMIAGLEKPDEGLIHRQGRVSMPLGGTGGLSLRHSGRENARRTAALYGQDPDITEAFTAWMADIGAHMDMPAGTWSQGTRARFSFSLMLAFDFDYYLIDEGMPLTTDQAFNRRAREMLTRRLSSGTAVIVSHQGDTIRQYCRRAAILRHGQLAHFADVGQALHLYESL